MAGARWGVAEVFGIDKLFAKDKHQRYWLRLCAGSRYGRYGTAHLGVSTAMQP